VLDTRILEVAGALAELSDLTILVHEFDHQFVGAVQLVPIGGEENTDCLCRQEPSLIGGIDRSCSREGPPCVQQTDVARRPWASCIGDYQ
jgi:hypothetical protein